MKLIGEEDGDYPIFEQIRHQDDISYYFKTVQNQETGWYDSWHHKHAADNGTLLYEQKCETATEGNSSDGLISDFKVITLIIAVTVILFSLFIGIKKLKET